MKKIVGFLLLFSMLFLSGCSEPKEVVVAILDTGVSTAAISSENLLPGWNYVQGNDDTEDRVNHGTAVVSVILGSESANITGVAPNTKIVPLTVADEVDGETKVVESAVLAQALRDCVDQYNACIINVSLGSNRDDPKIRSAIKYVQKKGALVIAAAGNGGEREDLYYPAAYDGVISVGSHDEDLKVSDFTQMNADVDILAPGEDVWFASRNGKPYGAKGTSYASAYVSGVAAIKWENNPKLSTKALRKELLSDTTEVDGWKILNAPKE